MKRSIKNIAAAALLIAVAACAGKSGGTEEKSRLPLPDSAWESSGEEAARILSDYIKVKSVNPPGDEALGAKFFANILDQNGISYKIYDSAPGRANLVARIKGNGSKKPVILHNHIDVVAADPALWSVDPYGGVIKDGYVWGRGALDMKGQGVAQLLALLHANKIKDRLDRDVVFMAVADEEQGGKFGAGWMVKNHPEETDAEYVLSEGGFGAYGLDPRLPPVFLIANAEKGVLWLRLTAHGTAGHGSIPRRDNANLRLARALTKIGAWERPFEIPDAVTDFIRSSAKGKPIHKKILYRSIGALLKTGPVQNAISSREELYTEFHNTISITVLKAGYKENVIPSDSEAVLDCRVLPGMTSEKFIEMIKAIIDDPKIDIEIIQWSAPSQSPINNEMFDAIAKTLKEMEPSSAQVPFLFTAGTDLGSFRDVGIAGYGIAPYILTPDDATLAHGVDERISIANLGRAVRFYTDIVEKVCAGKK